MRFTNPVGGTTDGALFFWSDGGRPRAILKFFTYDNERFTPLLQSLSEDVLAGRERGHGRLAPERPGGQIPRTARCPRPSGGGCGAIASDESAGEKL